MPKEQLIKPQIRSKSRRLIDYTGVSLAALAVSATAYAFTTFATKEEVGKIDTAIQTMVQMNHKMDLHLVEMKVILNRLERRLNRGSRRK